MHICFNYLDYPSALGGGGVGNQAYLLARHLVQQGHRATVIAMAQQGLPDYDEDGGVRVHRIRSGSLHWQVSRIPFLGRLLTMPLRELERSWAACARIEALHREDPFDAIEGIETGMFFVARRLPDVPYLIRLHGDPYTFRKYTPGRGRGLGLRLSRLVQRRAMRKARLLVATCQAHGAEVKGELGRRAPRMEFVLNVLADRPAAEEGPPQGFEDRRGPVVLYVGRLETVKGVLPLLAAAARVLPARSDAHFVLVGSPHPTIPASELAAAVAAVPGNERLHLLGHVSGPELTRWYRRASVCAVPSFYETFGLTALEPLRFGVPVVAARGGGLPEIVEDGATGLLVPCGDAAALATAITRLLDDPELARRLGEQGGRRAERFRMERLADANRELWQALTGDGMEAPPKEHLFFSAHLDDAVLSCGGLVHAAAERGDKVRAITVFAGVSKRPPLSAFARHLHRKWGLPESSTARLEEDLAAFHRLGVADIEQWDYLEAPYRHGAARVPLYASYEALKAPPVAEEDALIEELTARIRQGATATQRMYFPLALGGHVDHRLLNRVGLRLRAGGWDVRFYEDWPYADAYELSGERLGWLSETAPVCLETKLQAILEYKSQLAGLGGSANVLRARMRPYAVQAGDGRPQERYWHVTVSTAERMLRDGANGRPHPFALKPARPALRQFRGVLGMLQWHDLDEVLPIGEGLYLDIGCGDGRHRALVEQRGYRWVGIDQAPSSPAGASVRADCRQLPIRSEGAAAVGLWQVLEYVEDPEKVLAEARRVLEPGGVFCGSVSFLEPIHGRTLYGISPLLLERLLHKHGFRDVRIRPGLSGFVLLLWTWLRRLLGTWAGCLAIPLVALWLLPLAGVRFFGSWLAWRLGLGGGHGMSWVSQRAPLEFAGHVLFVARKAAREEPCT